MKKATGVPDHRREIMRRLVEAGCEVFAQYGYRDATVQRICGAAGVNGAAVNYYFDGKRHLYRAVWQHLHDTVRRPLLEAWRTIRSPRERLEAIIGMCTRQAFEAGDADRFRRIIHREIGDPTDMFEGLKARYLKPTMQLLRQTVGGLIGASPEDPAVRYGAFSLHSQLMALHILRVKGDGRPLRHLMGSRNPGPAKVQALVAHLSRFTLAGLDALRAERISGRVTL